MATKATRKTTANRVPRLSNAEEAFAWWCRMFKVDAPKREYVFHPIRKWRLDFAWPDLKIALEIDGGIWIPRGGAHSRPMNIVRDLEKHNALTLLGWRYLRVQPKDVQSGEAMRLVDQLMAVVQRRDPRTAVDGPVTASVSPSVEPGYVPPSSLPTPCIPMAEPYLE